MRGEGGERYSRMICKEEGKQDGWIILKETKRKRYRMGKRGEREIEGKGTWNDKRGNDG